MTEPRDPMSEQPPPRPETLPDYKAVSIHHPARLKPLRQAVVYWLTRGLLALAARLPMPILQWLGRGLGRLGFWVAWRDRRLARMQLEMALPELPPGQRERIARACFRHQGMTLLETLALPRLRRDEGRWVALENEAALLEAHRDGRGVILVSAHSGNWELVHVFLGRLRIKGVAMATSLNNARINELIVNLRRFEYMDVAERGSGDSPRQLLRALKRGEALVMINDVDIETNGVFVDFFGRPAHTPRAPATLALKMACPVVTYLDRRLPDGRHVIRFDRIAIPQAALDADDPVKAFTQVITARVERHIRAHPEQWAWNHRRWKRRPQPEEP